RRRLDLLVLVLVLLRLDHREAALADGALVDVVAERGHVAQRLELRQRLHLDLADALARQVHDRADVLERRAAAIGDVERARLVHVPDLEVGEVELDGARARRHVEEEVVLARDVRARARALGALGARARLLVVGLRIEHPSDLELALRHALDADRARADLALAPRAALLARDRRVGGRARRASERALDGEAALGARRGLVGGALLRRSLDRELALQNRRHAVPPNIPEVTGARALERPEALRSR